MINQLGEKSMPPEGIVRLINKFSDILRAGKNGDFPKLLDVDPLVLTKIIKEYWGEILLQQNPEKLAEEVSEIIQLVAAHLAEAIGTKLSQETLSEETASEQAELDFVEVVEKIKGKLYPNAYKIALALAKAAKDINTVTLSLGEISNETNVPFAQIPKHIESINRELNPYGLIILHNGIEYYMDCIPDA